MPARRADESWLAEGRPDTATYRKLSGSQIAAMERSNQLLPWRTDLLSPIMFQRLTMGLCGFLDGGIKLNDPFIPAAAALSASLFTGRPIDAFARLSIRRMDEAAPDRDGQPGLYTGDIDTVWWLCAGGPTSRQNRSAAAANQAQNTDGRLILRCGHLTEQLMYRSLQSQGVALNLSPGSLALFTPDVAGNLPLNCARLLRRFAKFDDCTTTLSKIEGWLFQRVVEETGDPATATIITGKPTALSHATSHYSSVSYLRARGVHARIVDSGDIFLRTAPEDSPRPRDWDDELIVGVQPRLPETTETVRLGSKFVPKFEEVRRLATRLRESLCQARASQEQGRTAEIHRVFTLYTIAMVGFATGSRAVLDPIPTLAVADRTTGFVVIDDKGGKGGSRARLSWLAPAALEQIARYERHLGALQAYLPEADFAKIAALRAHRHDRLPVFFIDRAGEIQSAQVKDIAAGFADTMIDFHLPMNAWRHYVRAELSMKVPGDVLHAFLGHWHRGQEPWSEFSALDPLAYRSSLASVMIPMLDRDGWEPECGLSDEVSLGPRA